MWSVRDYITSAFTSGLSSLSSTFTNLINGISHTIASIPSTISGLSSIVTSSFSQIYNQLSSFGGAIGGIGSVLQSVYSYVRTLATSITSSLSGVMSSLQSTVSNALSSLSSALSHLGTSLGSGISVLSSNLAVMTGALSQSLSSIVSTMGSSLGSLGQAITSSVGSLGSGISSMATSIGSALASVYAYLSTLGSGIIDAFSGLKEWFLAGFQEVTQAMATLGTNLSTYVGQLPEFLKQLQGYIVGGITQLGTSIGKTWTDLQIYFSNAYNSMVAGLNDVIRTLTGFINPLVNMQVMFKPFVDSIMNFFTNPLKVLGDFFKPLTDLFKPITDFFGKELTDFITSATTFFSDPLKYLGDLFKPLTDLFKPLSDFIIKDIPKFLTKDLPDLMKPVTTFFGDIGKTVTSALPAIFKWGQTDMVGQMWDLVNSLTSLFTTGFTGHSPAPIPTMLASIVRSTSDGLGPVSKLFFDGVETIQKGIGAIPTVFSDIIGHMIFTPYAAILGKFKDQYKGKVPTQFELMDSLGTATMGAVFSPYLISALMRWMGHNLRFTLGVKPIGIGGNVHIDVGKLFYHLSSVIWKIPDVIINSLGYGFGIWLSQPMAKLMNSFSRNDFPIAMPDIVEIRDMANRASVTSEWGDVLTQLKLFMGYYGYSDYMIEWNLGVSSSATGKTPEYLSTMIKDRFGKDIAIPLALRTAMPSGTELCKMMIRDVILQFEMFSKVMSIQGYPPDVSKMYYLLHYRYPSPEHLWNFYRRGMAGMLWWDTAPAPYPEKASGIGFDPVLPKTMNNKQELFLSMIQNYMKWHDYAPFGWMTGFPSDRSVMLDLMADIPMRIDARWLYKWSIIPEGKPDGSVVQSVFNIVRARGMHPDWEESLTVAECMNALQEERTYARRGILESYKHGFYTEKLADTKLTTMVKVTLLGKEWDVKNLEGERKLLLFGSYFDRALNVLRNTWSFVTSAFTRNVIPYNEALLTVKSTITNLSTLLGIDLTFDKAFLDIWLTQYIVRYRTETVQRIRSWMRIFIYRASQLAENGEEFEGLIDSYADKAMLTPIEVEIMVELGTAFINATKRSSGLTISKNYVKAKVGSGTWTIEEGIKYLVASGLSERDAKAYIETDVKTRKVSIDKLIAMADVIPISPEDLQSKMDAEGVPLDEQKLYMPYVVGKELKDEMTKLSTEIIDDFVAEGFSTAELRKRLDDVATLGGKTKTELGVDWLNISPKERDLLVDLAVRRRARQVLPKTQQKTLSSDKLITLMDTIPVSQQALQDKMNAENIPASEQDLLFADAIAKELSDEIKSIATEYVTDYANGVFTLVQLTAGLDDLATLGGAVPQIMGKAWIILSPLERQLRINLAKLRRGRVLAKQVGVK